MELTPRRGEIWWAALDPTLGSEIAKTRPCLVLTANALNAHRRTVVVVPLSSVSAAAPPIRVSIHCQGREAVAVIDQIRAIAKERLRERIEAAEPLQVEAVESALKQILELS